MSDREFTCECTASDRDNPQSEADIVDLQQTMICRFPKVCDSLLFRRWTQRYGILTNCDGYSDGPKNNHRNPSLLFRPNLLQRCTRFAHGVLRWIHYFDLIRSQRYQRKRSKEDDCLWACGASLARSWLWWLYPRCTGCCGGTQRTVEGVLFDGSGLHLWELDLLTRFAVTVTGKEAEQDGAEWLVRGGTFATTTRTVSICDRKVQRCSGVTISNLYLRGTVRAGHQGLGDSGVITFRILEFHWPSLWFGKWDSGFSIFIFSFSSPFFPFTQSITFQTLHGLKIYTFMFAILESAQNSSRVHPKQNACGFYWRIVADVLQQALRSTHLFMPASATSPTICIYNAQIQTNLSARRNRCWLLWML